MTKAPTKARPAKKSGERKSVPARKNLPAFCEVEAKINTIRRGYDPDSPFEEGKQTKMSAFERHQKAAKAIIADMTERGAFYHQGDQGYYLFRETGQLIALEQDGLPITRFLVKYGLNATEPVFKYVVEALYIHALENGDQKEIYRFSHLRLTDPENPVLDLALTDNSTLRVTKDSCEKVQNGTDDVLFLSADEAVPHDILVDYDPSEFTGSFRRLETLILNNIPFDTKRLSLKESRLIVICWMMAVIMRAIVPSRPILVFVGPQGSGKTTAMRFIGNSLFGDNWDVFDLSKDEKDFDALITSKVMAGVDNADERIRWFNNKLAIAATGGKIPRRVLYKTNRFGEFPIVSMLAISTRELWFSRPDVLERLTVLDTVRLDESELGDFGGALEAVEEILKHRIELWRELIALAQRILGVLSEIDLKTLRVRSARMQDWARFTVIVGRALGCEETAHAMWEKPLVRVDVQPDSEDVLFKVLSPWVQQNPGQWSDAGVLSNQLGQEATTVGVQWPYASGRSLGQKLRTQRARLEELFDYSTRFDSAKRQTMYSFKPKDQPESN